MKMKLAVKNCFETLLPQEKETIMANRKSTNTNKAARHPWRGQFENTVQSTGTYLVYMYYVVGYPIINFAFNFYRNKIFPVKVDMIRFVTYSHKYRHTHVSK